MSRYDNGRDMAYDNPQYLTHQVHNFGALAAGASASSGKFIAFTDLKIMSVTANLTTSGGTSTYTLWNGTATVTAIGAQTFELIRIMDNSAAGTAPSLSTATYGPFVISNYDGTSTNTQTNSTKTGLVNVVQLYGTGTTGQLQAGEAAANDGISVNQGDVLYIVQGTEATATAAYAMEFKVTPLAQISN